MTPTAPATPSAIRRALRRARAGATLNLDEASALLAARGEDLRDLMLTAARLRDAGLLAAGRPGVITYSPKVFLPVTRLCRDRCHYCTFVTTPAKLRSAGHEPFLSADEVLALCRAGAALGCKEALFTLGDQPEDRWPAAREWLDANGYDSTLDYLRALAIRVLEETGLLPHLNPGVLSWEQLARLKPVAPSMGMMLETTSLPVFTEPGGAHHGSPDKDPALRLRVLEDAGRLTIPFTTGILVGIGESLGERAESLFAIRRIARAYGGIQEVIVQNFRAKPDTAMRRVPDAGVEEYLAAIAAARVVLGPSMRIQAPPNLSDPGELADLLAAGVDDWGGVSPLTPDHVNPERPWPAIEWLTAQSAAAGFDLVERLTVHPHYVLAGEPWLDPRIRPHVAALADADGLARPGRNPAGLPWQEPESVWAEPGATGRGRTELATAIDTEGRHTEARSDIATAFGSWDAVREDAARLRPLGDLAEVGHSVTGARGPQRLDAEVAAALRAAETDPAALTDAQALALMTCEGPALSALSALADAVRADAVGEVVSYVVNRNINFTNVCYVGCRFCAFAQRRTDLDAYSLSLSEVGERAEAAWALGATEVCMQGGIDPDLPAGAYPALVREVKRRCPDLHVHAFSPMEVVTGAARSGASIRDWLIELRAAGLDTIPGTAAEILDDEVRWILTKGKLPAAAWIEVVTTAHEVGLRSSSTMMYGHVDSSAHWVAHLKLLARLQERSGGFTEFVPLPFVHHNAPIYLAGIARPGPTPRDDVAVHAMARLLLHGRIDNIQTSWVKLGPAGAETMLRSGVNDLGGTLMEETISRMAGSQFGSAMTPAQLEAIATGAGRPVRQRTTTYGAVDPERVATSRRLLAVAAAR
ncbi:MAG: bifunctional FO biosynthesis protein CofGH [Sporichthyaceae bacterium]